MLYEWSCMSCVDRWTAVSNNLPISISVSGCLSFGLTRFLYHSGSQCIFWPRFFHSEYRFILELAEWSVPHLVVPGVYFSAFTPYKLLCSASCFITSKIYDSYSPKQVYGSCFLQSFFFLIHFWTIGEIGKMHNHFPHYELQFGSRSS